MKKQHIKLALLFFLVLGIVIFWVSGAHRQMNLTFLKQSSSSLLAMVAQYYWQSVFLFMVLLFFMMILCLPGTALMSITGGFLFGIIPSVIYINVAASLGGLISFLIIRYIAGDFVKNKYEKQSTKLQEHIKSVGWKYFLVLRMIPVLPFFVVNILAALTAIPAVTFLWTTSLGILPTSVLFAMTGQQLSSINGIQDIFTLHVLGPFFILVLLLLGPLLLNKKFGIF